MCHIHATTYYLAGKEAALTVNLHHSDPDSSALLKDKEEFLLGKKILRETGCFEHLNRRNPTMKG